MERALWNFSALLVCPYAFNSPSNIRAPFRDMATQLRLGRDFPLQVGAQISLTAIPIKVRIAFLGLIHRSQHQGSDRHSRMRKDPNSTSQNQAQPRGNRRAVFAAYLMK
jgi:hypothetical protein